jgi:hypothetical protein
MSALSSPSNDTWEPALRTFGPSRTAAEGRRRVVQCAMRGPVNPAGVAMRESEACVALGVNLPDKEGQRAG